MGLLALILAAPLSLLSAASPAAAGPGAPALSADAAVSADGITVQFDESGLNPLEPISMSVTATKKTTSECVTPGPVPTVLLSTTTSGSATEVTDYVADPEGRIAASRRLSVTAAGPVVSGLPCALRTTYFATVVVTDLSHGVSVTVERRG